MTKTNTTILVVLTIVLSTLTIFLACYVGTINKELNSYKNELNSNYEHCVLALSDEMDNIDVSLSKLSVSNETKTQEKYLTQIVSLCHSAQSDLSALPIEHNLFTNTYKFVNQLGGYAFSLTEKLGGGNEISLEDKNNILELKKSSSNIKNELNNLASLVLSDYSIVDNLKTKNNTRNNFGDNFKNLCDDSVQYPSLIYDGPFSDSVENKEVKGLGGVELTNTEAESKVKKLFSEFDVNFAGETCSKDFCTYNFELKKDDVSGFVQITKKGELVLSYNRENVASKITKSVVECEFLAQEFANKLGFVGTQVVWSQDAHSCVYCNLCYVKDGIVFYPDMIKIKICRQTGDVIGLEAQSWAYNHTEREKLEPSMSEEVAKQKLSKNMETISSKLCVIPDECLGEKLCWEFKCYFDDAIYYVYIDAQNGEERKVLKVVETEDGSLLM